MAGQTQELKHITPPPFHFFSFIGAHRVRVEVARAVLETTDGGVGTVRRAGLRRDPYLARHVGGKVEHARGHTLPWTFLSHPGSFFQSTCYMPPPRGCVSMID